MLLPCIATGGLETLSVLCYTDAIDFEPETRNLLMNKYRTHNCAELSKEEIGNRVRLAGWVDTIRDHGGVIFIDLRDHYGVTQVVVNDEALVKGLGGSR